MGLSEKLVEIKNETSSLLNFANETTGVDDTRLGDAVQRLVDGFGQGGSLPAGIEKVAVGDYVLESDIPGNNSKSVIHNLGVVPDIIIFFRVDNLQQANTIITSFKATDGRFPFAASDLRSLTVYHASSSTGWSYGTLATYGITFNSQNSFTLLSDSSRFWRAGEYKYIVIKLSEQS